MSLLPPIINPSNPTITATLPVVVTITDTDVAVLDIYYWLNNSSTPIHYTVPFILSQSDFRGGECTIYAYGQGSCGVQSATVFSNVYYIPNPTFDPPDGTVETGHSVLMTIDNPSTASSIKYSVDGVTWNNYVAPFNMYVPGYLAAYAYVGNAIGATVYANIYYKPQPPVISPPDGSFYTSQPVTITITDSDPDSTGIGYTIDGSDPTTSSTTTIYIGPFDIAGTTIIRAFSYGPSCGHPYSDVTTAKITINPCNDGSSIPLTTALDIIKRALRLLTVLVSGESVEEPEAHDFLQQLNWLVQSFANEKLMSWQVVNEFFNLVPGKQTYSIGPDSAQDFNTSLPIQIEGGFIRLTSDTSPIDWPLYIMNNEQFNQIRMKGISTTYPQMIRYTRSYPYGAIDFYPVPAQAIQVCLTQRKQFKQFSGLNDIVCLPPGYKDCLAYWLAIKMSPEYGRPIDQITMKLANDSKAQLKDTNSANSPVIMGMDSSVVSKRLFNFQSGWNAL